MTFFQVAEAYAGGRRVGGQMATEGQKGKVKDGERRENFNRWKLAVRVPEAFPALEPLSDEELDYEKKFYAGPDHDKNINEILLRARAPRTRVIVARGHGCTTLSRFVFKRVREKAV